MEKHSRITQIKQKNHAKNVEQQKSPKFNGINLNAQQKKTAELELRVN